MRNFQDKWALITGSASGIGRALALEFSRQGCHIILADLNSQGMEETAAQIQALGRKTLSFTVDLSKEEDVKSLAKKALEEAGSVDILVNNAGYVFVSEVKDTPWRDWKKMLAVLLEAPILLTSELLPHFISKKSGHIVNISSLAGLVGAAGMAPYCTAKFGLVGFSDSLRGELYGKGIGVTVVCPGFIRTGILKEVKVHESIDPQIAKFPPLITMSAEKAASKIVQAVRKDRGKIILTFFAKYTHWMYRMFPRLMPWLTCKVYPSLVKKRQLDK